MHLFHCYGDGDNRSPSARRLRFEALEDRWLLAAAASFSSNHDANGVGVATAQSGESTTAIFRFAGTSGDDVFRFGPGSNPGSWTVHVNDDLYPVNGGNVSVALDGLGGHDFVTLIGSKGDDLAEFWPDRGMLSGQGYTVTFAGFSTVAAVGNGGVDVAKLHDDPAGNDTFVATPDYGRLQGDGFFTRASSFRYVHAFSSGGTDVAKLYDDPDGNDTFVATPDYGRLQGDGFFTRASSFPHVHAFSSGGIDVAKLQDDPDGNDTFVATPDYGRLQGDGFFTRASSFRYVHAFSSGGADVAKLHDDPGGNDTFVATPDYGRLQGDGFFTRASSFRYVHAFSSGGADVAKLHDDPGGNDTFVATPDYGRLQGEKFYNRAAGFPRIIARGTGGFDRAKLYDSNGEDLFFAAGASAELETPNLVVRALDFKWVRAVAIRGGYDMKHQGATDYVLETVGDWSSLIALDGEAFARIVVPDQATATERFAAEELQSYLFQISGAQLQVQPEGAPGQGARLLVGATLAGQQAVPTLAAQDPDAFLVRTVGDDLVLVGATERATLYAVYDYLEDDLNTRWLGPGPNWEEVPRMSKIGAVPVDRTESPAMKYRLLRMTGLEGWDPWYEFTLSWAAKQKINVGFGWPPDTIPEQIARQGGYRAWMHPHGTIPNILPPSVYFDAHPEWYALVGGKRRNFGDGRTQLSTTNPEVIAKIAEGIGRIFDTRPEIDFVPLVPADSFKFSEDEASTALDTGEIWPFPGWNLPVITERWLTFVNAVARRLQVTHPGKKVYTLAYHQTFRPPDPTVIKPEPNVIIQVVHSRPNYVCFVHRLENGDSPNHVKFRQGLEDWAAMTPGGVIVYDYVPHTTFAAMPYPAPYKFIDDIKYLHRVGVVGYEGQTFPDIWGTYGVTLYAIAKATWDPSVNADALVKEYSDAAFGAASEPMQRFFQTIGDGLVAADHTTEGIWSYMTPGVMAQARSDLDAAHQAAVRPIVKLRLRDIEIGFHYGELGNQAWKQAQEALANQDAVQLEQAIQFAQAAADYLLQEQAKEPHHAATPGKLTSLYLKLWQAELAKMR